MVIISKAILVNFGQIHPDAIEPLNRWYELTKKSEWRSFSELKNTFGTVDAVGNERFVFNIKGNDYRLVVMIFFDIPTVFVRFIGKHSDYDRIDCSTI